MPKKQDKPNVLEEFVYRDEEGQVRGGAQIVEWNDRVFFVLTKKWRWGTDEKPEFFGGFWFDLGDMEVSVNNLLGMLSGALDMLAEWGDFSIPLDTVLWGEGL